jgi:hypothetical protein
VRTAFVGKRTYIGNPTLSANKPDRTENMTLQSTLRSTLVAGTFFCASALAQTRFCLGGDLEHLSAAQKASCSAKMQAVKEVTRSLHAPEDWHFVVVCGEQGWQNYTAFYAQESQALAETIADTHLSSRETFLRESRLQLEDLKGLRKVLAHEVAGILLKSHDEVAISTEADRLLAGSDTHTGRGL